MSEQSEQFKHRIEELVTRFERDIDRHEWITRRYPKRLRDEASSLYEVPALYVQKGATSLLLDPIGYDMPGADAAADIYLMPAYDPMASLYFESGYWLLHYADPIDPPDVHSGVETQALSLTPETINQVLNSIAGHAVPSV